MFVDEFEQSLAELRQGFFFVIPDLVELEIDHFVLRHIFKPVNPAARLHRNWERAWRKSEHRDSRRWSLGFADDRDAALFALGVADGEEHFLRVRNQSQTIKKLWRAEEGIYFHLQPHRIITRSQW